MWLCRRPHILRFATKYIKLNVQNEVRRGIYTVEAPKWTSRATKFIHDPSTPLRECWRLFSELSEAGAADEPVYSALILRFVRGDKVSEAVDLVEKAHSAGVQLPIKVYHGCMNACRKQFDETGLYRVLSMIKAHGLPYTIEAYNIVLAAVKDSPRAVEQVLASVKQAGLRLDNFSYSEIIDSYCTAGKFEVAESCLEEMLQAGIKPTIPILNNIIKGYGVSRRMYKAEVVLDSLKSLDLTPSQTTFSLMITGYARENNLEKMLEIPDRMELEFGTSPNLLVFSSLFSGLKMSPKGLEAGKRLIKKMQDRGLEPNEIIWTCLQELYERDGLSHSAAKAEVEILIAQC